MLRNIILKALNALSLGHEEALVGIVKINYVITDGSQLTSKINADAVFSLGDIVLGFSTFTDGALTVKDNSNKTQARMMIPGVPTSSNGFVF